MGSDYRTLHQPFGFDQGDPLIICRSHSDDDIRAATKELKVKGYYCGPLAAITGRRHDKVYIVIHNREMSPTEFVMFWRWISESVMTSLPPGGGKGVVFV